MNCELVLLAAGQAKRFGSDKRFAAMSSGSTVWRTSLQVYLDAGMQGHVIVSIDETTQFPKLPAGVIFHECTTSRRGMSHSLSCGLKQVSTEFALVALADMPFVRPETIKKLLSAAEQARGIKAIEACYQKKPGHPKLLHRDLFDSVSELEGDQGGMAVLRTLPCNQRLRLDVDDPGILRDIDLPADLDSTTH